LSGCEVQYAGGEGDAPAAGQDVFDGFLERENVRRTRFPLAPARRPVNRIVTG